MTTVANDMVVTFRYVMMNARGEILEDTTSSAPTCYLHGSDAIATGLQLQMQGLVEGDISAIALPAAAGIEDDFYFKIYIQSVRPATEKELFLGYPLPAGSDPCDENCECHKN